MPKIIVGTDDNHPRFYHIRLYCFSQISSTCGSLFFHGFPWVLIKLVWTVQPATIIDGELSFMLFCWGNKDFGSPWGLGIVSFSDGMSLNQDRPKINVYILKIINCGYWLVENSFSKLGGNDAKVRIENIWWKIYSYPSGQILNIDYSSLWPGVTYQIV